jgi:hypothetical protein
MELNSPGLPGMARDAAHAARKVTGHVAGYLLAAALVWAGSR